MIHHRLGVPRRKGVLVVGYWDIEIMCELTDATIDSSLAPHEANRVDSSGIM